jgi:hypothetical protein
MLGQIVGASVDVASNSTSFVSNSTLGFTSNSVEIGFAGIADTGNNTRNFLLINLDVEHAVPAPATLVLFGLGLAGLGRSRRKKA